MKRRFRPSSHSRQSLSRRSRFFSPPQSHSHCGRFVYVRPPGATFIDSPGFVAGGDLRTARTDYRRQTRLLQQGGGTLCLEKMMEWDFRQIILAHGHPIRADAKKLFEGAYKFLLGTTP